MNVRFDPIKLADTKMVADKLADLPKDALMYISGYADGFQRGAGSQRHMNQFCESPPAVKDSA